MSTERNPITTEGILAVLRVGMAAARTATASPFNRHELVRIATAARHYYATCNDPFSSEGVGAAVVDALHHLGALDLVDVDHVSADRREVAEHEARERDEATACTCSIRASTSDPRVGVQVLDPECPVHGGAA